MDRRGTTLTAPGPSGERVVALDALRGVAVAGIALMNVYIYALPPAAYFNPAAAGSESAIDWIVWAVSFVLVEDKFRSLFAMLFGAGVAILFERAQQAEKGHPLRDHALRMLVLFAIGGAHAILLANNDVLRLYAMAGLFLPLFLRLDTRRLLVMGGVLMVLHVGGGTLIAYQWLTAEPGTQQALLPASAFGANPEALSYGHMIGTESFAERLARRIAGFGPALETQVPAIPSTLSTMLVGAGLWRSGLLQGCWPRARCIALARKLALIAVPPLVLLMLVDVWSGFTGAVVGPVSLFWSLPFDLLLAIAYAALVMALFAGRDSALRRVLAATGRLSLTNYLLTSAVFALLFYSWGLGLYGTVSRGGAFATTAVPIALMMLWSPLWLARFRQGPFEWLWRGIARGRFGPIGR
ncbi:DUF418 domain-containing protein [Erythrobacter sp. YJ-T3-07]|uniref:DUF418 domain-containing protein n=1 Tax=Erythrobacter sp. YJ-T3-07 TaxID=2793063 RepID=UPI0018D40FC5|nr:DUF418 domain-containing protein [Erythrobacter sp. YJ-T3-07]MBH1942670.1 DUF418 domain-containing protein [Erythrobacter sp. YJ-T3-07]